MMQRGSRNRPVRLWFEQGFRGRAEESADFTKKPDKSFFPVHVLTTPPKVGDVCATDHYMEV